MASGEARAHRGHTPGDFIIYYSDASHVAFYLGDAELVQPRPGSWAFVSPAASM